MSKERSVLGICMVFALLLAAPRVIAQSLKNPALVNAFYQEQQGLLSWCSSRENAPDLRRQLLTLIDSAAWQGLDSNDYHIAAIRGIVRVLAPDTLRSTGPGSLQDSLQRMTMDRTCTDAAIALCKDLYQGAGMNEMMSYDGVLGPFSKAESQQIVQRLSHITDARGLKEFAAGLLPAGESYAALQRALDTAMQTGSRSAIDRLAKAMNSWRWTHHHVFPRSIIVNIASATLRYYEKDSLRLTMKIVAGQPSKRTPRFAAWCDQLILYPYWNVPRKIAVNELLPLFKSSPALVETMNMQILDTRGKVVDPLSLRWEQYNRTNFPFAIRQATGCDNALGVVKFNLTSPYAVYMHDTNLKSAFRSAYRYYSHGCIRLEKPEALGNALLDGKLDTALLQSCLKDQQPYMIRLHDPVPVFVIYNTADADETGRIDYYKDIYHLMK